MVLLQAPQRPLAQIRPVSSFCAGDKFTLTARLIFKTAGLFGTTAKLKYSSHAFSSQWRSGCLPCVMPLGWNESPELTQLGHTLQVKRLRQYRTGPDGRKAHWYSNSIFSGMDSLQA